jgi:hypothetical protein
LAGQAILMLAVVYDKFELFNMVMSRLNIRTPYPFVEKNILNVIYLSTSRKPAFSSDPAFYHQYPDRR